MTDNSHPESHNIPDATPSEEEALTTEAPTSAEVKKKKKKKKKANKPSSTTTKNTSDKPSDGTLTASNILMEDPDTNASDNPSEGLTEEPTTLLTLPVKPDEWFVTPATFDEDGNKLTEQLFVFLQDGIEIINMPLTEANFAGLTAFLNERFAAEDTQADYFHIRKPSLSAEESHPVMTLTQNNRILATTVLDQKTLKKLIKALQSHVIQTSPFKTWVTRWWAKHRILRVFVIIAATPVALILLYTVFWGMTH